MGVNYRVNGDVNVTPAIAPIQHDWSLMQGEIANQRAEKAKKEAQLAAENAAKAKQAAEEAKYNPDGVDDIDYNDTVHKKAMGVLDYSAQSYKNGTTGSAEHNYNIGKLKQETELLSNKGKAAISAYKSAYNDVDQLPKYVDKGKLNTQIYDASHPKNEKGEIDFNRINPKNISDIAANYYGAINTTDMYGDKMKDIGEKVHSNEITFPTYDANDGTALGQMIRSDSTKAKFFKAEYDNKGNVTKWVPGVTNEAANFLLNNDHEIRGEAEDKLDKYIIAESGARKAAGDDRDARIIYNEVKYGINAQDWLISHVKGNMERLNEPSHERSLKQGYKYRNPGEGEDDDFKAVKVVDQKRNLNVGDGKEDIRSTDVPEEYRFSGKKLDQPVSINSSKIYDENTNKSISGQESVGDKKLYPTRTFQIGYDTKTGKYLQGSIDDIKKNPNAVIKWMVGGTMDATGVDKEGKEKKIKKNVMIPYEEVSNDIKAKYGFDLQSRPVSDISDLELGSYIKEKHPNATAEERLKIFKKIRGQ